MAPNHTHAVADGPLSDYDGYQAEASERYFDLVADARQHCPVAHSDAYGGYWIVTGHDDIRRILSDHEAFSNKFGIVIPVEDRLRKPPQDLDPPLQSEFRRLLNRFFSRHGLARHLDRMHELAAAQVEAILPLSSGCDIVADFAKPLTAAVLSTVILDLQDQERFEEMSRIVAAVGYGSAEGNSRAFQALQSAVTALLATLHARERRDDVLDAVLYGRVMGRPLTHDEQVGTVMQLLLGGLKTTVAAIGHIVALVAQRDGMEDRLREPDWVRADLDEFLRYESPVKMIGRSVTKDVTIGTQCVHAGEMVAVMLASANRDDRVFADPDNLELGRQTNPHLAFGLGVHRCIGSNLARIEITSAINALLARIHNIKLVPGTELHRTPSAPELSWASVPITFDVITAKQGTHS